MDGKEPLKDRVIGKKNKILVIYKFYGFYWIDRKIS